eukprot:1160411-Pelagomonas_calceolata.AAC.6
MSALGMEEVCLGKGGVSGAGAAGGGCVFSDDVCIGLASSAHLLRVCHMISDEKIGMLTTKGVLLRRNPADTLSARQKRLLHTVPGHPPTFKDGWVWAKFGLCPETPCTWLNHL